MHDDEDVAFDNAVQALKTYGGTLIAVETGGKRNQDGIDPNRNFSADGIGCTKLGNAASPALHRRSSSKLFDPAQPIIALHNNHRRPRSRPAASVTSRWRPCRRTCASRAADDPDGPLAGERTLVLLAAAEPARADGGDAGRRA